VSSMVCVMSIIPTPVLKSISIPESVASRIVASLRTGLERSERERRVNLAALQQRLAAIRTRMNQIYEDKLDGKISEEFWDRKQAECTDQERGLQVQIVRASEPATAETVLTVERVFELAQSAYSLYLTRNPAEQGQLLKSVLLNCSTDGVSLWPVYRKPFDLIFQRAKKQEWSGRADLNCRPLAPQARNPGQKSIRGESDTYGVFSPP
jgi:site-specific DNA recombinase